MSEKISLDSSVFLDKDKDINRNNIARHYPSV